MKIEPVKTTLIKEGDDIFDAFLSSGRKLNEGDIVVISSKIVALEQKRVIDAKDFKKVLKKEAEYVSKKETCPNIHLTLANGILIPNAGIDFSNIKKGKAILWPKNSQKFAKEFHAKARKHFKLKKLGVLIIDSHCQMLRAGTTAVTLACVGFEGVTDERNKKDLFGNELKVTKVAMADSLACAGHVVMGEAKEKTPFVIIKNAPVKFTNKTTQLKIQPKKCLFRELYPKELL